MWTMIIPDPSKRFYKSREKYLRVLDAHHSCWVAWQANGINGEEYHDRDGNTLN